MSTAMTSLSERRRIAILLRQAGERFDERSLSSLAALMRRAARDLDGQEREIARLVEQRRFRLQQEQEDEILTSLGTLAR